MIRKNKNITYQTIHIMKIANLILVALGLTGYTGCFSQDSIVKKDSANISVGITYYDVDLKIKKLERELDSLYSTHKFKHPMVKTGLRIHSQKVKEYIQELLKNGRLESNTNSTTTDAVYNYKFRNSTLLQELDNYLASVNASDLNATVKKVAIGKAQRVENIKTLNSYTHKYNESVTILKVQLSRIIESEIYSIDNEEVGN
jgi:hypothetical protein